MAKLIQNSYGKSAVRLTKVKRLQDRHELVELSAEIQLTGDFEAAYTAGDNSKVVPTDTMKNTVYGIAATHPIDSLEEFAIALASHFVEKKPQVESATVELTMDCWNRIDTADGRATTAFYAAGEKRTCKVVRSRSGRNGLLVNSGISDLLVLKTADSAFVGFPKDQFTTLPEVTDRIFATKVTANWDYEAGEATAAEWNAWHGSVRRTMLEVFAGHKSLGVQQTMYDMGVAALDACPKVKRVYLHMPNQHRIPMNLQPFGLENKNEIFVTTSEPYGSIYATVER